jgi:hypothetical protein
MRAMTKHRITALTIAAAVAVGAPASASAKPIYDNGLVRSKPVKIKKASEPAATAGCRATV